MPPMLDLIPENCKLQVLLDLRGKHGYSPISNNRNGGTMQYCKDCRFLHDKECWHPINTRKSPVDGEVIHDARWNFALSMRTSTQTLDCGPQARLFVPRLEVA